MLQINKKQTSLSNVTLLQISIYKYKNNMFLCKEYKYEHSGIFMRKEKNRSSENHLICTKYLLEISFFVIFYPEMSNLFPNLF